MKQTLFYNQRVLFGAVALLALSGCSGVKDSLGLTKDSPDEFLVVKNAPLEMPPQLTLPQPRPGAPRPQEMTPTAQAATAVFGDSKLPAATEQSSTEAALLQRAGADQADPNIRHVVEKESQDLAKRNRTVGQKLLGLGGQELEPSASVVDPKAEYERIKKNAEEGKPITEGETPSIEE